MRVLAGFTLRDFWESKPPAQSNDGPAAEFVITVPFKFVVGTHTLPPATYRFEVLPALTSRVWLLAVRGQNGQAIKLQVDGSQLPRDRPFRWKLIFDRREHLHFLTEVWLPEGRTQPSPVSVASGLGSGRKACANRSYSPGSGRLPRQFRLCNRGFRLKGLTRKTGPKNGRNQPEREPLVDASS